jgi:acetyl/propionyl-CoA carboxylase alpha subunit
MVHAPDRDAAIDRLARAITETEIGGIQTTLPFHAAVARSVSFRAADLSTGWVDEHWDGETARADAVRRALVAAGLAAIDPAALDGQPGVSHGAPAVQADRNGWRHAARADGADRWPG